MRVPARGWTPRRGAWIDPLSDYGRHRRDDPELELLLRNGAKLRYEGSVEVEFNGQPKTITRWREVDPDTLATPEAPEVETNAAAAPGVRPDTPEVGANAVAHKRPITAADLRGKSREQFLEMMRGRTPGVDRPYTDMDMRGLSGDQIIELTNDMVMGVDFVHTPNESPI